MNFRISRREMLAGAAAMIGGCSIHRSATTQKTAPDPIIDIHQHANYIGRSLDRLLIHQRNMGVTQTILLPFGSTTDTPATKLGKEKGIYKAVTGTIDVVMDICKAHPGEYYFCANEVPDLPAAPQTIEKYLKMGGKGVGEMKFTMACDAPEMQAIYEVAQQYEAPVTLHIEFEIFTLGYERLGTMLQKYPKVKFIGHAQGFWANIDATQQGKRVGYPKGKITPGGLTDRYLSDYLNLYGDMSAYSALNALIRDEEHAVKFIERHQDKLLFGSDCPDAVGHGPTCSGSSMISAIRRLSPSKKIERKLLYETSKRVFKL